MLAILALLSASQVALAPVPVTVPPSVANQVSQGQQIATESCATCHAIGKRGLSPNPAAPQFRHLSRKYPIEHLSEAFAEGVLIGHSVMPEFEFAPDKIDGLVAYIKSIQVKRLRAKNKRR
jgi:cytochrome c